MQREYRWGEYEQLEKLFAEALLPHGNIPMWLLYLSHVQQSNQPALDQKESEAVRMEKLLLSRQIIIKAFELAVSTVGFDYGSLSIWQRYLAFIRSWPVL